MIEPHGEKPADPVASRVHVGRLITGEAEDVCVDSSKQPSGKKGGQTRAQALTPEQSMSVHTETWVAWRMVIPYCDGGVGQFPVPDYLAAGPDEETCLLNYRSNWWLGIHEPIPDDVKVTPLNSVSGIAARWGK